jgi:hypothetical protein
MSFQNGDDFIPLTRSSRRTVTSTYPNPPRLTRPPLYRAARVRRRLSPLSNLERQINELRESEERFRNYIEIAEIGLRQTTRRIRVLQNERSNRLRLGNAELSRLRPRNSAISYADRSPSPSPSSSSGASSSRYWLSETRSSLSRTRSRSPVSRTSSRFQRENTPDRDEPILNPQREQVYRNRQNYSALPRMRERNPAISYVDRSPSPLSRLSPEAMTSRSRSRSPLSRSRSRSHSREYSPERDELFSSPHRMPVDCKRQIDGGLLIRCGCSSLRLRSSLFGGIYRQNIFSLFENFFT